MLNRKSPRLHGFDYSSSRVYFVTINCHNRQHLFGEIEIQKDSNKIILSEIGMIAAEKINEISSHHLGVEVMGFVVMPNHIHMLISLQNQVKVSTLSTIVGSYKSGVSRVVRKIYPQLILWQGSFADHIIWNERDLLNHFDYIRSNVDRW